MTDKEIIKSLECCIKETSDCDHCPLFIPADADCFNISKAGALDIIYRLQAENERLNNCVKSEDEVRAIMKAQMTPMVKEITNEQIDLANKLGRISGILELKNKIEENASYSVAEQNGHELYETKHYSINAIKFNNLVKEMVGDTE